jgi:hypothetical protein
VEIGQTKKSRKIPKSNSIIKERDGKAKYILEVQDNIEMAKMLQMEQFE